MDTEILLLILIPIITAFLIPLIDLIDLRLRKALLVISVIFESLLNINILLNNYGQLKSGDFSLTYHLGGWMPPLGINLAMDSLGLFFSVIVSLALLLLVIYSIGFIG